MRKDYLTVLHHSPPVTLRRGRPVYKWKTHLKSIMEDGDWENSVPCRCVETEDRKPLK
jgi:hypothetical protein